MCSNRLFAPLAAATAVLMLGQAARAELLIQVNKSTQRMIVSLDGKQLYVWPVSTGGPGYDTPSGTFRPFRKEIDHYSEEWDNAPMPYSIFFTKTGDAVHGTYEQRSLGRAVSHGCVRLSVKNAATLWKLVEREKMANTTVVLTGTIPAGGGRPAMARARPVPLNADDPRYATPDQQTYGAPPRDGDPSYDDHADERPVYAEKPRAANPPPYGGPPPFSFFLFGR